MAKKIEELEDKLQKSNDKNEAFQKAVMQNQNVTDRRIKQLEAAMKAASSKKKKGEQL